MKTPYSSFIGKLKKLYGSFDPEHMKFEKAPNSEIARDLGYSDAQFSRLVHQTASEGEYQRANLSADRLLELIDLRERVADNKPPVKRWPSFLAGTVLVVLVIAIISWRLEGMSNDDEQVSKSRFDMLEWSFETSFITPYTKLSDLPGNCQFDCYKYQGKWKLDASYKLPIFRERDGFHYVATDVNMYARCLPERDEEGRVFEGYEYQKHEIWYDLKERPMTSFLDGQNLSAAYAELDLAQSEDFVKVADVHTFFRNEFELDSGTIIRSGKVVGRDVEFNNNNELQRRLGSGQRKDEILSEVNTIIINRLKDFSKPISCNRAEVPNLDVEEIEDGARMAFDCQMTTSRVSIDYQKTYVLDNQYIKNDCRPAP